MRKNFVKHAMHGCHSSIRSTHRGHVSIAATVRMAVSAPAVAGVNVRATAIGRHHCHRGTNCPALRCLCAALCAGNFSFVIDIPIFDLEY